MNIRSYNFASKGRSKRGLAGWRKPWLENDLAVRLGVGGELHNAVEDLVELGVIGLERQLLGHKVDRNGFDALELGQLVLKLARTVGAIDLIELLLLLHGGFLSRFCGLGAGRAGTVVGCYSQIWLMPWLSMV